MTYRIEIELGDAAFRDPYVGHEPPDTGPDAAIEVGRILSKLAGTLADDMALEEHTLRDINGNTVGKAEVVR